MPYPRLRHPVRVSLCVLQRSEATCDPDMREEISDVQYSKPLAIEAQMDYRRGVDGNTGSQMQRSTASGQETHEEGYALFRVRDLAAIGVTALKAGDIITAVQDRTLDKPLHIMTLRHVGHYPQHGSTLVKAYFTDRDPLSA